MNDFIWYIYNDKAEKVSGPAMAMGKISKDEAQRRAKEDCWRVGYKAIVLELGPNGFVSQWIYIKGT